jgi:hypothetical protein
MQSPPKPTGVNPIVFAGWIEKPDPEAVKSAVTVPTVSLIGSDVWMGAESKSKCSANALAGASVSARERMTTADPAAARWSSRGRLGRNNERTVRMGTLLARVVIGRRRSMQPPCHT